MAWGHYFNTNTHLSKKQALVDIPVIYTKWATIYGMWPSHCYNGNYVLQSHCDNSFCISLFESPVRFTHACADGFVYAGSV